MIAAWQENLGLVMETETLPQKIFGVKFIGLSVAFYGMSCCMTYLDSLNSGLPKENITIEKGKLLTLMVPTDRLQILQNFCSMRELGLQIKSTKEF